MLTTVEGGVVRLRTRPSLWNAMRPPSDEQSATAILRGLRPNTSLRKACSLFRPRGVVRDSGWRSLSGVETLAWRSLPRVPANAKLYEVAVRSFDNTNLAKRRKARREMLNTLLTAVLKVFHYLVI